MLSAVFWHLSTASLERAGENWKVKILVFITYVRFNLKLQENGLEGHWRLSWEKTPLWGVPAALPRHPGYQGPSRGGTDRHLELLQHPLLTSADTRMHVCIHLHIDTHKQKSSKNNLILLVSMQWDTENRNKMCAGQPLVTKLYCFFFISLYFTCKQSLSLSLSFRWMTEVQFSGRALACLVPGLDPCTIQSGGKRLNVSRVGCVCSFMVRFRNSWEY